MIGLYKKPRIERQSFKGVKKVTVPNQSMSLRTIIQKFVRNEPVNISSSEGYYEESMGDLEKLQHQDLFDLHEMYVENRRKLEEMQEKVQKTKAAKQKAEYDALIESEVQKRLASQKPPAANAAQPNS